MGEETLVSVPLSPPRDPYPTFAVGSASSVNHDYNVEDDVERIAEVNRKKPGDEVMESGAARVKELEEMETFDVIEPEHRERAETVVGPSPELPQPEAPPGSARSASLSNKEYRVLDRSKSANSTVSTSSLTKFLVDRRDVLSAAISKRLGSRKESGVDAAAYQFNEITLSGVKVIVRPKTDADSDETEEQDLTIKGQVSFFSRSGCRDCTAVRSFFRSLNLPYVEINLDVFPEREEELVQRTSTSHVPQIFLNEHHIGSLTVLNSLRNSGEFEKKVRELAGKRAGDKTPAVPVYGFDYDEGGNTTAEDSMVGVARVLRQRLPIQDRFSRMKLVKNCFTGSELVDVVMQQLECGREKAIEIGKELLRKHFIHHVFREHDFEDGPLLLYRFLEHDPSVPKYYNFRGATNDNEPKSANFIGQRLSKIMIAILESYASDDRLHLDYQRIATSEEFRRYGNLLQELQRVDVFALSAEEKLSFFLNLYNSMVVHAIIRIGQPGLIDRRSFYHEFQYIVGGYPYSLSNIRNGILRSNRREPYTLGKPFSSADKRVKLAVQTVNPIIHFGLCDGTRSSPAVRFYSQQGVEMELRHATREFFLHGGVEIDLEKRTVHLTTIIKRYSADFGQDREILQWLLGYVDASKTGLLTHLLNDGGQINISYQDYDRSLNV